MRVQILCNGVATDGTARLMEGLADRLVGAGDTVNMHLRAFPRGIGPKVRRMLTSVPREWVRMRNMDLIVVHTAVSLCLPTLLMARLRRIPVVSFVWDVYPESTRAAGNISNPFALAAYAITERLAYRLCDVLLVATSDYLPYVPERTQIFPMWPIQTPNPPRERPLLGKRILKLAFAGQINPLRDIDGALVALLSRLPATVSITLEIYSRDPVPDSLADLGERDPRLKIQHNGVVAPEDLQTQLQSADIGLVTLAKDFELPAFPSKIMTYVAAGIPVLYFGAPLPGVLEFLQQAGLGAHIEDKGFCLETIADLIMSYEGRRQEYLKQVDESVLRLRHFA